MPNTENSILAKICSDKLEHIARQKILVPFSELLENSKSAIPTRGFLKSIQNKTSHKKNALIAEIKKASPSKGIIRPDFNPSQIASAYENGCATCISVLTDTPYFQGSDEYLGLAKRACKLPILRKDFMLDPYQIFESRALGADCILLIMAALSDSQASELENAAFELGMDVLVEVHDEAELERALLLKSKLIGINNRNLKTLAVDIATTPKLVKNIPAGYTIVCESGIASYENIVTMNSAGVYTFLVGESLMLQNDIEAAVKKLLGSF